MSCVRSESSDVEVTGLHAGPGQGECQQSIRGDSAVSLMCNGQSPARSSAMKPREQPERRDHGESSAGSRDRGEQSPRGEPEVLTKAKSPMARRQHAI